MEHKWLVSSEVDSGGLIKLQSELNISKPIAELLIKRGVDSFQKAKTFFRPSLDSLYDPFLLKDMARAVSALISVINKKGTIIVYGDYDVDGTTSVAMMTHFLRNYTDCEVSAYIPDRYGEGYGLSKKFVDSLQEDSADLVITLDCGIRAVELVAEAKNNGVEFIICDHHEPSEKMPEAAAVLDPKRADCDYPFDGLSGCGVGFKLIQALLSELDMDSSIAFQYLDLLTISIGADIVPIDDENRTLAHFGLKEINQNPRAGIKTILDSVGLKRSELTIGDVVFILAPRINAAGRIGHAMSAVELLLTSNSDEAAPICNKIEDYNKERKSVDKAITSFALDKVKADSFYANSKSTVVWGDDWHKGVIGIVASRLIENFYKPTIVLTTKDGVATGSARSVKGIDIHEALGKTASLLDKFGGHTMAAGMSIKEEKLPEFREKFEEVIAKEMNGRKFVSEIIIDLDLSFSDIDGKFYKLLSQFAPFGPKNMTPLFVTRRVLDAGYTKLVGETKDHVKFTLKEEHGDTYISGIGFKQAHHWGLIKSGRPFDVVYAISMNEWNGNKTLQLEIRDIKESSEKA